MVHRLILARVRGRFFYRRCPNACQNLSHNPLTAY